MGNGPSLYEHENLQGSRIQAAFNQTFAQQPGVLEVREWPDLRNQGFNDVGSSLIVPDGYRVDLFEHVDFAGQKLSLGPGTYNTLPNGWNDMVSSMRFTWAPQTNATVTSMAGTWYVDISKIDPQASPAVRSLNIRPMAEGPLLESADPALTPIVGQYITFDPASGLTGLNALAAMGSSYYTATKPGARLSTSFMDPSTVVIYIGTPMLGYSGTELPYLTLSRTMALTTPGNVYLHTPTMAPAVTAPTPLAPAPTPLAPVPVAPAVVSPDLLRPNFVFHPKMDSYGGDLKPDVTNYKNQPAEIYRACVERPGCVGFNTNGYLKEKIEPQLYQWTEDPTVGLVTFDPELKTYTGLRHELLSDNSQFLTAVRTNLQNAYAQKNPPPVTRPSIRGVAMMGSLTDEIRQYHTGLNSYIKKTVDDALAYLKAEPVKSIELAQKLGFAKAASDDPQAPKIDVTPGLTTWVQQLAQAHQAMPTAAKVGAQVTQFSRNNGQLVLGLLLLAGAGVGGWYLWRQKKRRQE
jgi:hypothetical protein